MPERDHEMFEVPGSRLRELRDAEAEVKRLRAALTTAQGEAYLGTLAGDDTPDPLAACENVIAVCREALDA